jgi:cell division protein FtsB
MYALLCLFFFSLVWMAFLYRIFINLRRENEIKRNNQEYYKSKIIKLKKEIYERREGRRDKEA